MGEVAPNGPVFVDRSGRRRRLVARVGVGVVALLLVYAIAMVGLALLGVHVEAPGLPGIGEAPHVIEGSSGDPRVGPAEAGPSNDVAPVSTPTTAAVSSPATTTATPASTPASTPTGGSGSAGVRSSASAATTSATSAPSATTTKGAPTAKGSGRSTAAPGATHRATPTPGSGSTTRPAPGGKSTTAPGRTRTHP